MKKVNMDVMQRWITQRITSLLGFEDDIVVGTCVNYLSEEEKLDPKKLQLQLTGFLEKSTGTFMEELWGLLLDAQNSLGGIPSAFLQDKKQEMLQAQEAERRQEDALRQTTTELDGEAEKSESPSESTLQVVNATSGSAVEPHERPMGSDGRRASRWGKPEAVGILVSSNISTSVNADTGGGGEGTDPEGTPATSSPVAAGEGPQRANTRDEISIDGQGLVERTRSTKSSRSRRDDEEEEIKEKKRKSKSKHGKKSDRKKSKSRHKHDERERRRPRHDSAEGERAGNKSGDDMSSSDDNASDEAEGKTGTDVEEALRLKALASVAQRKGQNIPTKC